MKIGEVDCLFVSWYKNGRFPLLSVGPSKGPMVFLILFAGFCLGYLLLMMSTFSNNPTKKTIALISIVINLLTYLGCLLGDSGIEPSIFNHYFKILDGPNKEESESVLNNDTDQIEGLNLKDNEGDPEMNNNQASSLP